jgi:hypothetical protein
MDQSEESTEPHLGYTYELGSSGLVELCDGWPIPPLRVGIIHGRKRKISKTSGIYGQRRYADVTIRFV